MLVLISVGATTTLLPVPVGGTMIVLLPYGAVTLDVCTELVGPVTIGAVGFVPMGRTAVTVVLVTSGSVTLVVGMIELMGGSTTVLVLTGTVVTEATIVVFDITLVEVVEVDVVEVDVTGGATTAPVLQFSASVQAPRVRKTELSKSESAVSQIAT